jgi:hypothetical protein
MKTTSSAAFRNSAEASHPPLARDAQGNLVAVPDGTATWCLKRDTGGRPKMIVGQDRLPARFALDTTPEDLEAMLGAGTFRVYALTEVGEVIDYVTTVNVGKDESEDEPAVPSFGGTPRGTSTDLRFALETILQMARAQSDSLRAVSEAQADWVKGLATAKALPRNAAPAPPPPAPVQEEEEEDEDDEDFEEEAPMPPWLEVMNQIAPVIQTYGEALKMKFAPPPPPPPRNAAPIASSGPNGMIHLSEINARLTPIERKFLNLVLRNEGGAEVTNVLLGMGVPEAVEFVKGQVANARAERTAPSEEQPVPSGAGDFMAHVMACASFLTPDERGTVLRLLPKFPTERREALKAQLLAMTPEEAAAWIRQNLDTLRAEVAS